MNQIQTYGTTEGTKKPNYIKTEQHCKSS